MSIQRSISLTLLNEYGIELPVIQIGAFWQSIGDSARTLSDLLGIATWTVGPNGDLLAGFPVKAVSLLEAVRHSGRAWSLVGQVDTSGRTVVREVLEASIVEPIGIRFNGATRI